MKYLQNFWRSAACLVISSLMIYLLFVGAYKVTPWLFQDSVWGKIGVLGVGIEAGFAVLYFAAMLICGAVSLIAGYRKTPKVLSIIPIGYGLIRYPWWLISLCYNWPFHLGFWQWVIVIAWIFTWVISLGICIGGIISGFSSDSENRKSAVRP